MVTSSLNNKMHSTTDANRFAYLDILRFLACLGVITIHASCQVFNSNVFEMPPIGSVDWIFAAIYNALSRFSVPVFLMISGALFIGREISINRLFSKYVLRLVLAYLVWSLFYAFVTNGNNYKSVIMAALKGHSRFGFICYLAGLYIATPVINKICMDKKVHGYFVVLCFVFCSAIPLLCHCLSLSSNRIIQYVNDVISITINRMNLEFAMGMTEYYVAGSYIHKYTFDKKTRRIIYSFGILGVLFTTFMTIVRSVSMGEADYSWLNYCWANNFFASCALFLFVKEKNNQVHDPKAFQIVFGKISKYFFGVYLIHTYFLDTVIPNYIGFNSNSFHAAFLFLL